MTVSRYFPFQFTLKVKLYGVFIGLIAYTVPLSNVLAADFAFPFKANSRDLKESDIQKLQSIALESQKKPDALVVIEEPSLNLKPNSKGSISAKVRSLKILEVLVRNGLDPARIQLLPVKPQGEGVTVKTSTGTEILKPTKLLASESPDNALVLNELSFSFASSSGIPLEINEEQIRQFLNSAGRDGHDALIIEGYADATGQVDYNRALSELRALSVYEVLVRRGLPPYRVDPKGLGSTTKPSKALTEQDKAAARKVNLRWKADAKVAEIAREAQKVETAAEPSPAPKIEEKPALPEPVESAKPAEPEAEATEDKTQSIDVMAFAGAFIPGQGLRDKTGNGAVFGLGLGKSLWANNGNEIRMALLISSESKFKAIESDRSGSITMNTAQVRSDYVFSRGFIRPYAGLGLGAYKWKGTIEQVSSSNQNTGSKTDIGGIAALGMDIEISKSILLSPEISWHRIGGDFSEDLLGAQIFIRWRI